jgi:hypothetical protein
VGHDKDLNLMRQLPVNDGKRETIEYDALSAVKIHRKEPRPLTHTLESRKKLFVETVSSLNALPKVPGMRGLNLPAGRWMVL